MTEKLMDECQFEKCDFRLTAMGNNGFAICPDFVSGIPSVLSRGFLTLEFKIGTTPEQARETERLMSKHLAGIAYHRFPEERVNRGLR